MSSGLEPLPDVLAILWLCVSSCLCSFKKYLLVGILSRACVENGGQLCGVNSLLPSMISKDQTQVFRVHASSLPTE